MGLLFILDRPINQEARIATFYGGEQLVNTVVLSEYDGSGSTVTIYTCPVGRYAKIYVKRQASAFPVEINYNSAGFQPIPTKNTVGLDNEYILINAGESLRQISGLQDYEFFIKEYLLP